MTEEQQLSRDQFNRVHQEIAGIRRLMLAGFCALGSLFFLALLVLTKAGQELAQLIMPLAGLVFVLSMVFAIGGIIRTDVPSRSLGRTMRKCDSSTSGFTMGSPTRHHDDGLWQKYKMKICAVFLMATLALPLSGLCQSDPQAIATSNTLAQAQLRGEARATADIATGTKQILYYGKPWSLDKPLIDEQSQLPVKIVEGCNVTMEFMAETDAYNAVMRRATNEK